MKQADPASKNSGKIVSNQGPRMGQQPVSNQTYIATPKDQPIGLNMDDFIMDGQQKSNDLETIDEIGKMH